MGQLTVVSSPEAEASQSQPPQWFSNLVRPQVAGRAVRVVAAGGVNPVVIVGEPADEIAEAWQGFYSLAIVWLASPPTCNRFVVTPARVSEIVCNSSCTLVSIAASAAGSACP